MTTSPRSSGTAGSSPAVPRLRDARGARWRSPAWSTRPCAAGVTPSAKGRAEPASRSRTRCRPFTTRTTRRSASSSRPRTSRCRSSSSGRTCRCSRACCRGRSPSRCSRAATTTPASTAWPRARRAASCAGSTTTTSSGRSTTCSRGPRRRRRRRLRAGVHPARSGLVEVLGRLRGVQGRRLSVPGRLLRRAREGHGAGRGHRRHELPHALCPPRRAPGDGARPRAACVRPARARRGARGSGDRPRVLRLHAVGTHLRAARLGGGRPREQAARGRASPGGAAPLRDARRLRPLTPVQEAAQGAGLRQRRGPPARALASSWRSRQKARRGRARGQEGARHGAQPGQERGHRGRAPRGTRAVEPRLRLLARPRQQGAHRSGRSPST